MASARRASPGAPARRVRGDDRPRKVPALAGHARPTFERTPPVTDPDLPAFRIPDSRDGRAYVIDPEVAFAVDVALATGRPLLLRGEPGSGKSSLVAFVAWQRDWRYYEHVVTSRTTARDLLWS